MIKELVKIEFRYSDKPDDDGFGEYKSKTVTIGIYDTIKEAIEIANKTLELLKKYNFEIRSNDYFKENDLFDQPTRLVSNCCYSTNRISYFLSIIKLEFSNLEDIIKETFKASERCEEYRKEFFD